MAGPLGEPSDKADAAFSRNPKGRGAFGRMAVLLPPYVEQPHCVGRALPCDQNRPVAHVAQLRTGPGPFRRQRGFTLIELIVFIVIVSVSLAGLLSVLNITVSHSGDPMVRKQMLSIAEALLEEVELQPVTYCDPTDATWTTATSATTGGPPATCTSLVQGVGVGTTGQVRVSSTVPFNNVADYSGASGHGGGATGLGDATHQITDLNGSAAAPLGFTASIAVDGGATVALGPAANQVASDGTAANMRVVRVAVTVNRGSDSLTLEGYRTRYWPNDLSW